MQEGRLILSVILVACLLNEAKSIVPPYLNMFTDQNEGGWNFSTGSPWHDLAEVGFNDVIKSVCGIGLWFLYEDDDYGKKSKFIHTFASHYPTCENLDSSMWNKITSVRFAGSDDIEYDTLTLYQFENMCGGEFLILRDIDSLITFNDRVTSLAVTGNSSWTLYTDDGYSGGAVCVIPTKTDGWYHGIWNMWQLSFPDNKVSSVKKGCYVGNVYEYVPNRKAN